MKIIPNPPVEFEVLRHLNILKHPPARKKANITKGRAKFLNEASELLGPRSQAVSTPLSASLMGWIKKFTHIRELGKENNMQWMKFATIVLVIALVFGGTVSAVKAAESSLPGQLMYQVKLMVENVSEMVADPANKVQQSMSHVENRLQEILRLREQNRAVPESAYQRLENQLQLTFSLMLGLTDEELIPGLVEIQTRLMLQEGLLQQWQSQGSEDAVLERLRTMLQARLQLVSEGIKDQEQFKLQVRDRDRLRESMPEKGSSPANERGSSPTEVPGLIAATPTPAAYGPGPGSAENTPTAGAYGPGPGQLENTPTPGAYGPGLGPLENTPTPGAYGPGPGPLEDTPTPGAYGPGSTPTLKPTGGGEKP
jgi:hypothetical protein